ncbi:MAG: DUF1983 domain-containing protein, partial [Nitrosospira sp.]|nr:DUF1983 domain-containing protein [Nitrosospira sp.]
IQISATSIDGLEAQYTVKIDNNGHVSGFGLASAAAEDGTPQSHFIIRADDFAIVDPADSTEGSEIYPFAVTGGTVYIDGAYIGDATIQSASIASLDADKITAGTITGSTLQTATSGQRFVVSVADGEAHFYGDRGDSNVEELGTVGINIEAEISDYVIARFGSKNTAHAAGIFINDNQGGTPTLSAVNDASPSGAYTGNPTSFEAQVRENGVGAPSESTLYGGVIANAQPRAGVFRSPAVGLDVYSGDVGMRVAASNYGIEARGGKGSILFQVLPHQSGGPSHSARKGSVVCMEDTPGGNASLYLNFDGGTGWDKFS